MSYTFSLAEQAQLQAAIDRSTGLQWDANLQEYVGVGIAGTNAVPFYQLLSDMIANKLKEQPIGLDAVTIGHLEDAQRWLNVAIGANGNTGMHAAFIRAYTNRQGELRLGSGFTEDQMQAASNAVASNFANSLLNGDLGLSVWTVPTISQHCHEGQTP